MNPPARPLSSRPEPVIAVAIVDDDSGIRAHLAELLNALDGFRCVGAYADGETALRQIPARRPDAVLMDINMPGMSGIECLRRLKKISPAVMVVMLTVFSDEEHLFESLKAGADGYLLKRSSSEELRESLRQILRGGAPVSPSVARSLIEFFHDRAEAAPAACPAPGDGLTGRELEILDQLAEGDSYKEIADRLKISIHTVSNHLRHIYEKLHVHSRAQAVKKHLSRNG